VIQLARYAAAETSPPAERARAMGKVVMGSMVGAIAGPLLVAPFAKLAEAIGLSPLSGPWLAAFLFYLAAMANTYFLLWPEPKVLARRMALAAAPQTSPATPATAARSLVQLLGERRIALAIGSLVAAQWAMVLVMTITPVHMHTQHHALPAISFIIAAHLTGMYGSSFLSGWLADKFGRMQTVGLGGVVLTAACLLAPLSNRPAALMLALFLLGLGWSFCFLGASGTLSEGLAPAERGRIQGFNEALVAMASGLASLGSGLLFATFGFRNLTLVGLAVSCLPCLFFLASRMRTTAVEPA
jgi:MFS family permease